MARKRKSNLPLDFNLVEYLDKHFANHGMTEAEAMNVLVIDRIENAKKGDKGSLQELNEFIVYYLDKVESFPPALKQFLMSAFLNIMNGNSADKEFLINKGKGGRNKNGSTHNLSSLEVAQKVHNLILQNNPRKDALRKVEKEINMAFTTVRDHYQKHAPYLDFKSKWQEATKGAE